MLPKPGRDHTSPLNYRTLSLLNSLCNLFEEIILKNPNFQLQNPKVIRNDEYGFERRRSAIHPLLRNTERITHGFNNNNVPLFLDTERSLDKLWATGLIAEFITAKIPLHLTYIIHNYLQNRPFSVTHRHPYSSQRPAPFILKYLRLAYSDPHSSTFTLILLTHLRLILPGALFPSDIPTKIIYSFLSPCACYMPSPP
jgi:hypothetical protein